MNTYILCSIYVLYVCICMIFSVSLLIYLYATCRIITLTTQGETSGVILDQYVNADVLGKLLDVLETQLEKLRAKQVRRVEHALEYAAHLRPISQVLVMLVKAYDRADSRPTTTRVACAVLKEYRSISSNSSSIASVDQQEDIAAIIYNMATILQVLVVHCGKLTYIAETHTYTLASSSHNKEAGILALTELLDEFASDKEGFCLSMKGLIGQLKNCSLRTAGQVCALIRCLLQTRLLYAEPDATVVDRLFSSAGELRASVIRLLEREAVALADTSSSNNRHRGGEDLVVEAIARMGTVIGILSLLRLYCPLVYESAESLQQADASLSNALTSLGQRVQQRSEEEGADCYISTSEVKRLLRLQVLADQVATLLNNSSTTSSSSTSSNHYSHCWLSTRAAFRTLLMTAVSPVGLGRCNVKVEALRDIVLASVRGLFLNFFIANT